MGPQRVRHDRTLSTKKAKKVWYLNSDTARLFFLLLLLKTTYNHWKLFVIKNADHHHDKLVNANTAKWISALVTLYCNYLLCSFTAEWMSKGIQFCLYHCLMHYIGKAKAPHSSTLAWKIPWTEDPGRLQSVGSQRARHDWATSLSLFTLMHWRSKWQPTPVFLPGESQGQGSLVGCCLWGHTELDTTEVT